MKNDDYNRVYADWVKSMTPEERAKAAALNVDKPLDDAEPAHVAASEVAGFSFSSKRAKSEPDAMRLSALAENSKGVEVIIGRNPFTDLVEKEREAVSMEEAQERAIKAEAISGLLSFLFAPKGGLVPNALDVTRRIYAICYCVRPSLIEGWSMQRIAAGFDVTKQAFSRELIKIAEKLNIRSRNQKPLESISVYAENTEAYHKERIAKAKAEKRRQYLREWNAKNREKKKAAAKEYYEENKTRIISKLHERRSKAKKG